MRVLVTGAAGFTGRHMMKFLASCRGVTPIGLVHRQISKDHATIESIVIADLLERDHLQEIITDVNPDAVIHLAGLTRGDPQILQATNVNGTKNLLDAVTSANPECRILVTSSSAVYGYAGDLPIAETAPLHPVTDYGASKVAQENLSLAYKRGDTAIAVARPFNLAGPGQSGQFICGRIINQIIKIEQQKRENLELLEIRTARDIIDVRDVVRGYWALLSHPDFSDKCRAKVFNIGSGNAYPISSIIAMVEIITDRHYEVALPDTISPQAIPTQKSDNTRIMALTGWRPEISLKQTLRDMLTAGRKNMGG